MQSLNSTPPNSPFPNNNNTPLYTIIQERCEECDGDEKRIIVRDAAKWGTLDQLPVTFRTRLADRLYAGLSTGFRVRVKACLHASGFTFKNMCIQKCVHSKMCPRLPPIPPHP